MIKRLGTIKLHKFEEKYMILGLDSAWCTKFENANFDVYIFKNRLYLRSQPIKK